MAEDKYRRAWERSDEAGRKLLSGLLRERDRHNPEPETTDGLDRVLRLQEDFLDWRIRSARLDFAIEYALIDGDTTCASTALDGLRDLEREQAETEEQRAEREQAARAELEKLETLDASPTVDELERLVAAQVALYANLKREDRARERERRATEKAERDARPQGPFRTLAHLLAGIEPEPAPTSTHSAPSSMTFVPRVAFSFRAPRTHSTAARKATATVASSDPSASPSGDDDPEPGRPHYSLDLALAQALEATVLRLEATDRAIMALQEDGRETRRLLADVTDRMGAMPSRDDLRAHDAREAARAWRERRQDSPAHPTVGPDGGVGVSVDRSAGGTHPSPADGRRLAIVSDRKAS